MWLQIHAYRMEDYQLSIMELSALRSHLQQPPSDYGGVEASGEHYQECRNLPHWHS